MQPAIDVRGLRKSFGRQVVLDGLDLAVERGEVFALLGPNGAGKTTTINVLTTLDAARCGHRDRRRHRRASAIPTRSGSASASPASRPPSTTCSPARRTS